MKKRIFAIMLVSMMLALTACGSTSTTNEGSNDVNTEVQATETVDSEAVVETTEPVEVESTESTEVESTEVESTEEPVASEPETSTYTYTDLSKTMYAQQTVNVRDLPDTNGNKVGGLSTNDEVAVTGQCNETGWYRISYGNGEAYVSNKYLGDSKVEVQQPAQNTASNDAGSASSANNASDNTTEAVSNDNSVNTSNPCPYPLDVVYDNGDSMYYYYVNGNTTVNDDNTFLILAERYPGQTIIGDNRVYMGKYDEGDVFYQYIHVQ